MKQENITLTKGLLIAEKKEEERKTKSGIISKENTSDFIVFAKVVNSSCKYKVGDNIIFHVLDSETFRDEARGYHLLKEEQVKGTYVKADK